MNYFTFDGVSSETYNAYIAESNMFDASAEDVESITIPGRNGAYHIPKNRFNVFDASVVIYFPSDMQTNVDDLRNFLLSRKKSCTYSENLRPNEFRLARFKSAFILASSSKESASMTLNFECQPERYLLSGQSTTQFTANGTITNPTLFDAKPLIRIYGTGTLTVGDYTVTVNTVDSYVDIDFNTLNAYKGDVNCNGNVSFGELVLVPGANAITLSGITKAIITPRWFTL